MWCGEAATAMKALRERRSFGNEVATLPGPVSANESDIAGEAHQSWTKFRIAIDAVISGNGNDESST